MSPRSTDDDDFFFQSIALSIVEKKATSRKTNDNDEFFEENLVELTTSKTSTTNTSKNDRSDSLKMLLKREDATKRRRRRVSFGSVSTRQYERVVEYHPCCRSGAPLGIGWRYAPMKSITVDAHQFKRAMRQSIVGPVFFPLPRSERENILKWGWNYTEKDFALARAEVVRIQLQRRESLKTHPLVEKAREIKDSCRRKIITRGRNVHSSVERAAN